VQLSLDPAHIQLHNDNLERRLEQALIKFSGGPVKLEIVKDQLNDETPARRQARTAEERQHAAEQAIAGDEHIKALQDTFNAEVRPETVRPRSET
jgi:DNA polymerase-3 subunit gamma/tau